MSVDLRQDRDRYVAFAFAAADLLLEIDAGGRVCSIAGAPQTICGRDRDSLAGSAALDLFAGRDRALVRRLLSRIKGLGRIDPASVRIAHAAGGEPAALLGGCRLPHIPDRLFVTLTNLPSGEADDARPRDTETGLLDRDALFSAAENAVAQPGRPPRRLTLLRFRGLDGAARSLPAERRHELMAEIGAVLRAGSVGGDGAGRLGAEEFGVIKAAAGNDDDHITLELGEATRVAGLRDGAVIAQIASLDLAIGTLDGRAAAQTIAYAVKRFTEHQGDGFTLSSLQQGLGAAVATAAGRFAALRQAIQDGDFSLVFQPIVSLPDRQPRHYEALARFADRRPPFEVITFGEEVGLIEEFDLAVCRKAIAEIEHSAGTVIAVNISGRSVQSSGFRDALAALLEARRAARGRLIFELTESSIVDRFDEASGFLRALREQGYPICLDDFGAGASTYAYLRHFDIDFVKIDGPFLKAAMTDDRERALVRSICVLCAGLGCGVIGEMIEDEAALSAAAALGVNFGQGWLFGKPEPALPALPPPRQRASRRGLVGASE